VDGLLIRVKLTSAGWRESERGREKDTLAHNIHFRVSVITDQHGFPLQFEYYVKLCPALHPTED
jgi:hypothetical protein